MEQSLMLAVSLALLALLSLCSTVQALTIRVLRGDEVLESYTDVYATYNDRAYEVPSSPLEGILVLPTPSNTCQQVNDAPTVPNGTNVFAFVENYCLGQSEIHLEDAGYNAMIAVMVDYDVQLPRKGTIAQALINKTFATFLKDKAIVNDTSNINPNTTVYVSLYDDSSVKLEELFIVFGVVLLAAMFLSIFIFCCSVCWRVLVVKWRNRGLTRWQVRRLPKRKYRRARDGACETCSICLEEFKEGETVRVLPCEHVFHPKCVDVWLQKWNRTCPLCKSAIKRQGKPLFTEDPESSHLLTDSGAPSVHLPDDETDGARGLAAGAVAMGGASNYGATEHSSPLRLVAGGGQHRRSASSTSASSRRSSQRGRSVPKQDPTAMTTIELNITSSEETSRSASHSPTPGPSPSQFHTPHQSDEDEATPSFKTANGENSTSSSVHV